MKKRLLKWLQAKEARKNELGTRAKATEDIAELRSINTELETINGEIAELRTMIDGLPDEDTPPAAAAGATPPAEPGQRSQEPGDGEQRSAGPVGATRILGTYGVGSGQPSGEEARQKEQKEKWEQRGADLKSKKQVEFSLDEVPELRATSIGGGTLVAETKYKQNLAATFNEVSRVIDTVNAVPLLGGEAYEAGFEVSVGEGDYTTETGNYTETDPVFGYVSIGKAKITAYAEMTDEAMKLPNVDYQSRVRASIVKALRKKISKQILIGAGGANAITGIFNAPTNVIPTSTDLTLTEIDADTLDNIVINYGGDEEVEGLGYLILNKLDLAAFAAVRDANGRKLYKIKTNGNTGTISSDESFEVPFIINSACPALSAAGTAADTHCMAYGMMMGYEMPIFSPVTVEESRDYKFRTGHVAYRGSVWAGGNVAMYKGFIRVKKGA